MRKKNRYFLPDIFQSIEDWKLLIENDEGIK